jgi:hypothetical protein
MQLLKAQWQDHPIYKATDTITAISQRFDPLSALLVPD